MWSFSDITKIANEEIECPPYVFRVGCFECIRDLTTRSIRYADDLQLHPITGTVTNHDCPHQGEHVWFVQACLWRADTNNVLAVEWGYGSKIAVSPHMAHGELVKKFLVAALGYAEHEVREAFQFRGHRIFNPHIPVEALCAIAEMTETR